LRRRLPSLLGKNQAGLYIAPGAMSIGQSDEPGLLEAIMNFAGLLWVPPSFRPAVGFPAPNPIKREGRKRWAVVLFSPTFILGAGAGDGGFPRPKRLTPSNAARPARCR